MVNLKRNKVLLVIFSAFLALVFSYQLGFAQWVPDDDGNLHWWDPPKSSIQRMKSTPVLTGKCNAHVLFMMDTSGSMNDEFDALCSQISDIVQGLQAIGITIEYEILGIHANRACTTGTVSGSVPNPTVNHVEDWGPAVEDVARQYNWKSGYTRIAIPVSDEGAYRGDPWDHNDDAAIERAKWAARQNSVGVIPVIGTPPSPAQYPKILAGAQELANFCWGEVFLSTDPSDDMVDGIIQTINNLCTPTSDKIGVHMHVDDAFAEAGVKGYVNKIAGDIAFLVAHVTNDSGKDETVDLTFSYPPEWELVDHEAVMRRKDYLYPLNLTFLTPIEGPWIEEACTEQVDISTPGKVTIQGIDVAKKEKSNEYIVKVIIPENQGLNSSVPVETRVTTSAGETAVDIFAIRIKSTGDMILTNRHLLFERHRDKEKVFDILKEAQKVALNRDAIVFYVDWWDKYDNFAKNSGGDWLNPGGVNGRTGRDDHEDEEFDKADYTNPIKWWGWDSENQEWNRDVDSDATQPESVVNTIPNYIDEYTHYWYNALGTGERHLMIVGGDHIIPFYRFQDPLHAAGPTLSAHSTQNNPDWGGITAHLRILADNNYALTDIKYADTDNIGWGNGGADDLYVGRVVGQNTETLLSSLRSSVKYRSSNHATVTSWGQEPYISEARTMANILEAANYDVNDTVDGQSLIDDNRWQWAQHVTKTFLDPTEYYIYRGHGDTNAAPEFAGVTGNSYDQRIDGTDIKISSLFRFWQPFHLYIACLAGLADHDFANPNADLMTYGATRNNVTNYLGATTVSSTAYNGFFGPGYLRYLKGKSSPPEWCFWCSPSREPWPAGKALNKIKNDMQDNNNSELYSLTNFAYTLYGAPWNVYTPPSLSKSAAVLSMDKTSAAFSTSQIMGIQHNKTIDETIDSYQIIQESGFDFISVPGYEQLRGGLNTTPVLPLQIFEINLPKDVTINDVLVNRSNPVNLGALNIPVTYDRPPLAGEPSVPYYNPAPDHIGMFDFGFEHYLVKRTNYNTLFIKVVPATYNTATNEAVLYQNYEIALAFKTGQRGMMLGASPDKRYYTAGETITTNVSIANIMDEESHFDITVELKDSLQNTVQTNSTLAKIDASDTVVTPLQFQAPSVGGSYWVYTRVTSTGQELGTSVEHINVTNGDITDLVVPECIPGTTVDFVAKFRNDSDTDVDAGVGLLLYDGTTPVVEFIPIVYTVAPGSTQDAVFTWEIPADFPPGMYLAVATVTIDGFTSSLSKEVGIGRKKTVQLAAGWNLISFNFDPIDKSPASVLSDINGKYSSAWGYENGAWAVHYPAAPGLGELVSMEAGAGYWINMDEAATLSVLESGIKPSKSIDLEPGWNLVGFNSESAMALDDALSSIDRKYVSVWAYVNGSWKFYDPAYPGFSNLKQMEPGLGYWINASKTCTWTIH